MQARRDENDRATALAVSSVDNVTPLRIAVDPVTNYLLVENFGDNLTAHTPIHRIDQNDIPTCYGVSSADGVTLIPIQTDTRGRLLIQYT